MNKTDYTSQLEQWLERATDDPQLTTELTLLKAQQNAEEIEDRFYQPLAFGTGGLRGLLGAGTNRMNIYTVRKASQGLANSLRAKGEKCAVAIAYDSRVNSLLFARETARVLAANGIEVWMYPRMMPTPLLSFAVRHLGCAAGVCITASHNPATYNGYKVYGEDGGQITDETAHDLAGKIEAVHLFDDVQLADFEEAMQQNRIRFIDEDTVKAFLDAVYAQRVGSFSLVGPLRVVYTSLHGAGKECVIRILHRIGIRDIALVPEQCIADGRFPTCPQPNPENPEAMKLGLQHCYEENAELLLATDPDCDRVGVGVKDGSSYRMLSGNEVGVLLFDYICQNRIHAGTMPPNPVAISTVVSTGMASRIARHYGVQMRRVLTGFKYIGEQIGLLEESGSGNFIFGFEESCGYLSGGYVRDKDGIGACMLICDMARWYKARGMSLVDALDALYERYGTWFNTLYSYEYAGAHGMQTMQQILFDLRAQPPAELGGLRVEKTVDYLYDESKEPQTALPSADMLCFHLSGRARVLVRPSGTEPKIKLYVETMAGSRMKAVALNAELAEAMRPYLYRKAGITVPPAVASSDSIPMAKNKENLCLSSNCCPPARTTFGAELN